MEAEKAPGAVSGFRLAAVSADVRGKGDGRLDLGLIYCPGGAAAAGAFTTNTMAAAPVRLCRERLGSGRAEAVLVNSGNANCMTGKRGRGDAESLCRMAAGLLNADESAILPCSTGVIGEPLPLGRMEGALPDLVAALAEDGIKPFSQAIMTTDTVPKTASLSGSMTGGQFTVTGVAKGAGMIAPDMATMLAFILTDADIPGSELSLYLTRSCAASFNAVTIDGDTSTNDSVIALASGKGPAPASDGDRDEFARILDAVCASLARQIVADGEGATRTVEVRVSGAATSGDADRAARAVAQSLLVKTALAAADPNWGRIACAVGYSGAGVDPDDLSLSIGEVEVLAAGELASGYDEEAAAEVMRRDAYAIHIRVGSGNGSATVLTSDLTEDYVRINCEYRS